MLQTIPPSRIRPRSETPRARSSAVARVTGWALLASGVLMAGVLHAADYRLQSATVDGGGQHSQGSRFAVEGTIGQPDSGRLAGSRFVVEGGFWPASAGGATPPDKLFANGFED